MILIRKDYSVEQLVIATKNKGKLSEFNTLLKTVVKNITCIDNYDYIPEINESGKSFEDNALIKARTVAAYTKQPTIADDSGLEVYSLNNEPGIYSARYAGDNSSDNDNINKLLKNLENSDKRDARFVCVIALVIPDKIEKTFIGECCGIISSAPRGDKGFGYDPIFLIPSLNKTFAEMDMDEKNLFSHRARAIEKLKIYLSHLN